MKNPIALILIFISMEMAGFSQTKSYDIISYTPPTGWTRDDKPGSRTFAYLDNGKETYGLIAIFTSIASSGNARKDFTSAWNALVKPVFLTGIGPLPASADPIEGYEGLQGTSSGYSSGKPTTVKLVSYTGGGKTISIIVSYSDDRYLPVINKFLKSVRLKSTGSNEK
jgi:hypothetical protein